VDLARVHGISPEKLNNIIRNGRKKLRKIKKLAMGIDDGSVRGKILDIHEVARKIFENFKKDPKDVKYARQFLNYYLDTVIKIIIQYTDLLGKNISSDDKETLKRAEEMLTVIEETFTKQLGKLYEDDFLDLDSELKVLEKTIKYDGV
jgi:5-bromo-4-chloroindolyl phosphate hydrolysis protein